MSNHPEWWLSQYDSINLSFLTSQTRCNCLHIMVFPSRVCIFSAQRLDGTNGKMKSNRKPKKFSSQPDTVKAGSHLNFHGLFRYSGIPFPIATPTSRIECTIYLDDQDLDFGTWLTIIWLKPTQWCDVKICYSIRTKKNGKGTQGLQRGAFVVQGISVKPGSNCQSRMIGGNKKNSTTPQPSTNIGLGAPRSLENPTNTPNDVGPGSHPYYSPLPLP